jgi:hypothetical protein
VLAAVIALVIAMVGAIVVGGGDPGNGGTADGPEAIDVPSAGQGDFDPTQATPMFPVTDDTSAAGLPPSEYLSDPTQTAERYLGEVASLPVGKDWMVIDEAAKQSTASDNGDEPPIQTATVAWSAHAEGMPDNPALAEGTVWLRNAELGGRDTWLVVGVSTRGLWLDDIHRDGDKLSFTVDRSAKAQSQTFPDDAIVTVDEQPVAMIASGEVGRISVLHASGRVAIIKVQNMDGGRPWSITSTAVPALPGGSMTLPEPEPPAPSTAGTPDKGPVVEPGTEAGVDRAGPVIVLPVEPPPSTEPTKLTEATDLPIERRVAAERAAVVSRR